MNLMHFLNVYRRDLWDRDVKLIRHVDGKYDLEVLLQTPEFFNEYQSRQSSDVFNCEFIISFIGEGQRRSRFIGVYEVRGYTTDTASVPFPPGFIYPEMNPDKYRYDLQQKRR